MLETTRHGRRAESTPDRRSTHGACPACRHRTTLDRRGFLQAGAVTAAAVAAAPSISRAATARRDALPTRKLGKTGVELTILDQGTWRAPGLDRLLRASYSQGVRVFDTAKSYGSEPGIGRWLQQMPEVRKEIFLVTKDSPRRRPR